MGVLDRLFRRTTTTTVGEQPRKKNETVIVGAGKANDEVTIQSFNNENFTFSGELADFDYVTILQNNAII